MCAQDISNDILYNQREVLVDCLKKLGVKFKKVDFGTEEVDGGMMSPKLNKVINEITYLKMKSNRFGGRTRSIHTKSASDIKGRTFYVTGIKFVKTGEYFSPSGGYNYEGEFDYDPGGLTNEKTHKILEFSYGFQSNWIEAKNV